MKVLHVSSGNLYGGIETVLTALARHRDACPAMEPCFGLSFEGEVAAALRRLGVEVEILGAARLSRPWTVLAARRRLRHTIARGEFATVVCHSAWPLTVFGPAVPSTSARLVLWAHEPIDTRHWLWKLAARVQPDRIVCNSRFTAASIPSVYPDVPTRAVYAPVEFVSVPDTRARAEVRNELQTPPDAIVIIQSSRMEAWKGHELHLQALHLLRDVEGWVCWIAGGSQRPEEAEYLEGIRSLAIRLGIADRVRFIGQRDDIPRILAAADLHCQPNLGPEPFGVAFVEALGAGVPCVTTALGGALEILDESCGMLVTPGDPIALAAALKELILDPRLRERLGRNGPTRAKELCDPTRQIERLGEYLTASAADVHVVEPSQPNGQG